MRNLLLVALCFCASIANAANYYLSATAGDDNRTNLQAQNPATPWRTIDKLNAINLSFKPGDSIFFRRGDTFFGSLLARASGTAASRIYYGAYGTGSNPVISGFTTLGNWTQHSGNIYYTSLDVPTLNMVTVNGEAKGMGRHPNTGFLKYEGNNGNLSITDNELPASPSWTGGEIVMRKYRFILDRHPITSHTGTTLNYSATNHYGNNTAYNPVKNNGYFIQNHLGTLDQQGEWYYDKAAKRLYVHFGGGNPSGFAVKASSRDYNAFLTTVNFLHFENLNFEGGNTKGLFMTTTSNTLVKDCHFFNQGGVSIDAVDVSWITVKGGTVNTSFSNGVFFEHNANNCTVDGVEVNNTNMIPGTQRSGTGISVGITINGNGSRIINNKVIRSGYNGISFLGDNVLVERNFVDTYCTLKDDGGGIYTYIGASNTISSNRKVKNNIIVNAIGAQAGTEAYGYEAFGKAAGIYLDEHVNNVEVSGNVVGNGDWSGIFLHNAHRNLITNNIFYNHRYQVLVSQYTAMTRLNTMTNNQYISKRASQETFYYRTFVPDNPSTMGSFDNNYYARPLDDNKSIHCDFYQTGGAGTIYYTLDQWRSSFALDQSSKKSPVTFKTNIDDSIRFEYNASAEPKVVALDADYVDVKNTAYSGFVALEPFTGIVLFKTKTSSRSSQTISFPSPGAKTFGDAPFTLNATATSGLAVAYRIVAGPAVLAGNSVTLTGAGTVTIEASQAGNASFNAALPVTQTITVARAGQSISFGTLANKNFGDGPFALNASASSGLPVSFRVISGPATIDGSIVSLTGTGTVWIEASQVGDNNYTIANAVSQSFLVSSKAPTTQGQTISFGAIGDRQFSNAPFALTATATSGLPVSYRVVKGLATVTGNQVTLTGIGTVTIEATQDGDSRFNAATPVVQSFVVEKATQQITFGALSNKENSDEPFTLTATASSGLPVSYRVLSGPATVTGNTITLTGATGTVWVEASQAGDANCSPANSVSQSFIVSAIATTSKLSQTINFGSLGWKSFSSDPFEVTASASSGLQVTLRVVSGPATIAGNVVTITGVGGVTIEASQAGNSIYNAASPVYRSFTIGKGGQTITFATIPNKTTTDEPFALEATASSGLPVAYRVISGPATVSGNLVTVTGVGSVWIEASQTGDANYNSAPLTSRGFNVVAGTVSVKQNQSVSFPLIENKTFQDAPFTLAAVATSGLPVSYRVVSGPATVWGNTVTLTGTGTVWIEASQAGNSTFNAATPVQRSVTVGKAEQAITFGSLSTRSLGDAPFALAATATSGLPVSYRVVSGPATVSGNTVTLTGAGTVWIEASQPGDNNFAMANAVSQSFDVVSLERQEQSIFFGTLGYKTYVSPDFNLTATASSGLPVSFRVVSGPATISGTTVSINGTGSVTIEASQSGNGAYHAASPVQRSFTVGKAGQSISFSLPGNKVFGDAPFALAATATSGLPVSYRVVSGPATVSGNTVTLTGAGTVWIEASQPGNENFTAAWSTSRSTTIVVADNNLLTAAPQAGRMESPVAGELKSSIGIYPNPVTSNATITVSVSQTTTGNLEIVDMKGRVMQQFSNRRFEKGQAVNVPLNSAKLVSGIYIIRLVTASGITIQRFQVVK